MSHAQGGARIVHVSADFPDCVDPAKTPVIRDLIALAGSGRFRHEVVSLNRAGMGLAHAAGSALRSLGAPRLAVSQQDFAHGLAVTYGAPARGLFHATMLRQLGDWLAGTIGPEADLLVGHKLTVEGIAVRHAAHKLGCPFGITIQGNTDTKILAARPDLAPLFGQIFHEAASVVAFAPWALGRFEERFGRRIGPTYLVPCPTDLDQPIAPRAGDGELVSLFHLRNWRTKNLDGIGHALRQLGASGYPMSLTVLGGGSAEHEQAARAAAGNAPGLSFAGAVARADVQARLNGASGFVMPSRRETFGLVFIEALMAGLPIIYPKGYAVDGYFDGQPFAIGVNAGDTNALAAAMRHLVEAEVELKLALKDWQESGAPQQFQRDTIGANFSRALESGLAGVSQNRFARA